MSQKVLIVVHQEKSTPGRVGEFLTARGYSLDRRCPNLGDPLPTDLSEYAASVVFGGPMSANDDHLPGIRAELEWLEKYALPSRRPLLGICLGGQQIARVLGARVGKHRDGLVEIGYYEVTPTKSGGDFLDCPTVFYQWHTETFEIPGDAVHLAHNENFAGQAFRYDGCTYAIEFHPEMTREMVASWCQSEGGAPKLGLPGAQPREAHLEGYARFAAETDRWLGRFLDERLLVAETE
ncbi:MAG: glutamine amidotransferase [Gammaproteobacteria bacterium]